MDIRRCSHQLIDVLALRLMSNNAVLSCNPSKKSYKMSDRYIYVLLANNVVGLSLRYVSINSLGDCQKQSEARQFSRSKGSRFQK